MAHRNRMHPLVARRAMRALREDPDDTAAAIRVIVALSGNSVKRNFRRFQRSERGARILREKRDLYAMLTDQQRLNAMPAGSLGRAVIDWFQRENISTTGLVQASEMARGGADRRMSVDEQL